MKHYSALNPVRHNGKLHQEKEVLVLDDQAAAPLLDCQAIALLPDQPISETEPEKTETTSAEDEHSGAENETSEGASEPEPGKAKKSGKKKK